MNPERLTEIDALAAWRETDTPTAHALRAALQEVRAALDEATARADVHEYTLADLRRQMEELRERGNWPVAKVVAEREAAEAQACILADALEVIPPERLEWLADWLDIDDERSGRVGQEVQSDLRRMASLARAALDEYRKTQP